MQAIEILKPGTYTDAKGQKVTFTAADLAACAAAYDTNVSEAPIVVGHPKVDAPAYGWIKGVAVAGDRLVAEPHQLDAAFADLVKAGRYKKVSASLFRPDAENNPTPGKWYLRHVGFLGAQAPAVKGLKAVQLADTDTGIVDLAAWTDSTIARAFRSLRDFFIGEYGQEKADRALPPWTVDSVQEEAAVERAKESTATAFADPALAGPPSPTPAIKESDVDKKELDARDTALKAEEKRVADEAAALVKRTADLAEREAKARRDEDTDLLDELIDAGKLAPGHKPGLLDFMAKLDAAETVEFSDPATNEKDATKNKTTERAWFHSFLAKLPKAVSFAEVTPGGPGAVDLADGTAIAEAARALQTAEKAKGIDIDIATAARRVASK